jgi:RNA polymerase sigma-70 factor (ECF subfamily)
MTVERELVEMAQRGDQDAFEAVVRFSADRLYAIAFRILRDPDAADDAMQEALVDAWRDLPMLRDPGRLDAWLTRLLVRACYRAARRDRRRLVRVRQISVDPPTTDDELVSIARRDELDEPFRRLTPEHRAVVVLRFFVGLTIPEIAETLGIPLGTAASRLHYALQQMRATLEADGRQVVTMRHPA